ncbi:MAG: NYN domain-containing protein [Candidatus Eisenbacteria bacterium]|uniref:NYN domain-containing protein n=1 Tax=Eiseniibacteriota bacterium TaxID=2212470 RepID=A0A933SE77_UNCEI|nr:NYN domain-containing protein [Candidatus Eisenbacteria bacterium]
MDRLIVIDGYNLIHRTPQLKPGDGRTLRQSREKLLNLLTWMMGANAARILVVFDGAVGAGSPNESEGAGRIEVRFSRPPMNADMLIREIVEDQVERVDQLTVVTADIEVAQHARAMGAKVSIADLFLAAALGPGKDVEKEDEKPQPLSKADVEKWAKFFEENRAKGDEDPDA